MKKNLFLFAVFFAFFSCEKNAGEGGTSLINGKVMYFTTSYNTQTQMNDTHFYPKAGKDVYIIYSDNEDDLYDDKFETDWDGRYHFEYLRTGKYIVFTHVDSIVVNDVTYDFPVFQHVDIKQGNSTNTLSDFIIQK